MRHALKKEPKIPYACERTRDDCVLWFCPSCRTSGVVTRESLTSGLGFAVIVAVRKSHAHHSPHCDAEARALYPDSWYRELIQKKPGLAAN